jgi:hypothetical protein
VLEVRAYLDDIRKHTSGIAELAGLLRADSLSELLTVLILLVQGCMKGTTHPPGRGSRLLGLLELSEVIDLDLSSLAIRVTIHIVHGQGRPLLLAVTEALVALVVEYVDIVLL